LSSFYSCEQNLCQRVGKSAGLLIYLLIEY
jgi:hypothetical protein